MSNQIFALNPRCKDKNGVIEKRYNRGYAEPATVGQIMDLMFGEGSGLKDIVEAIREGQEKLKDTLPFLCPHYAEFKGNHRAQAAIIPEAFTFRTCVDVDDKSLVDRAIEKAQDVNASPFSDFEGAVEYIEYSARKKVHIWLRLPVGMTVAEAQQAFCEEIGVPYDESCITPERFIYMTGDEVFRSPQWLQPLTEEDIEARREAYRKRGLDADGAIIRENAKDARTYFGAKKSARETAQPSAEATGKGTKARRPEGAEVVEANERTSFILKKIMEKEELNEAVFTDVGGRHNAVKMILAHATQLLTQGEFLGALGQVWPTYDAEKDITALVADFYSKYYDKNQPLTMFQKQLFRESRKLSTKPLQASTDEPEQEPQSALSKLYASQMPPQMPEVLPRLVRTATSQTPAIYKATVAQAIFPALATYPRRLNFTYIDNQERELRINCLTVAETGAGKDTCVRQPLNHILADLKERDAESRERLKKFNEEFNSKASTKQKPKRPEDLVIQTVKSDITRAALIQRMDDAQGAPLYVKLNELEQWDKVECAIGRQNQFTNLKLADDEDNDFGADRAGTQSVTASTSLHLNWNANTTITKAQRYFSHVLIDGPLSRLCLATIPEPEIGADIPVFGQYGERYDDALRPFIDNLKAATGSVRCRQALKLARELKAECAEFARLSQDRVFDNLSHRALVHAFRKACLLYAANGMKWEHAIGEFCRWSLHYDLWIKLHLWGDAIRKAEGEKQTSKRGPRNLLEQIKTDADGVFSYQDALNVRLKADKSGEGTQGMLYQWKSRGYIESLPDNRYKKLNLTV